jgi:hypothetical protein
MSARTIRRHLWPFRQQNVDWFLLQAPDSDVSSTMIREWIASGKLAACADYLFPNSETRESILQSGFYSQNQPA